MDITFTRTLTQSQVDAINTLIADGILLQPTIEEYLESVLSGTIASLEQTANDKHKDDFLKKYIQLPEIKKATIRSAIDAELTELKAEPVEEPLP